MAQERKAAVTLRGNPLTLAGPEIKAGQTAPDFSAVTTDLKEVRLADARGKVIVLSSVPSLDTPTCDTETRRFNQEAAKLGSGVEVWTISRDLPFAQPSPISASARSDRPTASRSRTVSTRARSSSSARTASSGTSALAAAKSVAG